MHVFWWRRVREERARRVKDEERLAETQADWTKVHAVKAELHAAYGPNGWTGIAMKLFSHSKEG